MKKTNEGASPVGILLPSTVVGVGATLLLMLCGAMLVQRGTLHETAISPCALLFLSIGSALAAATAAKRAPGGRFIWAVGAGALLFFTLLIIGILILRQPIHPLRTVISFLCMLVASSLGGFAGANMRKKKRYHYVKK